MKIPYFHSPTESLHVSLQQTIQHGMEVYCTLPHEAQPGEGELNAICLDWIETHTGDPLRAALVAFVNGGFAQWRVLPVSQAAAVPQGADIFSGLGEIGERRFALATHVVAVSGFDVVGVGKAGLFAVLAGARSVAHQFDGVIFDPATLFFARTDTYAKGLPSDGSIAVAEHIKVPHSVDNRGDAWVTTRGMAKFGLPDLEVTEIPANLCDKASDVVCGVARLLVIRAHDAAISATRWPVKMLVPGELSVTIQDIMRASGKKEIADRDGVAGTGTIALGWHIPRPASERFLRLAPVRSFRGEAAVWWYGLLSDLFGSEHCAYTTSSANEIMEQAHFRAVSELPSVKERFQRGLPLGQMLFLKRGFPVTNGPEEFMWVLVGSWNGDHIQGSLSNDSRFRLDLRAGQSVDFRDADIYDWLISDRDGSTEGGYTSSAATREGTKHDD